MEFTNYRFKLSSHKVKLPQTACTGNHYKPWFTCRAKSWSVECAKSSYGQTTGNYFMGAFRYGRGLQHETKLIRRYTHRILCAWWRIPVVEVGNPTLVLLYRGCVLSRVHLPEFETPIFVACDYFSAHWLVGEGAHCRRVRAAHTQTPLHLCNVPCIHVPV
jgi:hypothetical protein